MPIVNNKLQRPAEKLNISYGIEKITPEEDAKIKQWVNGKYGMYDDDYKNAVYKDAYNAVAKKKRDTQINAIKERERNEMVEKANYYGDNPTMQQQKQLSKAELAFRDAADIIKKGQKANGIKVDESLTDKQTVDKFLEANTEKPFAEYVTKFLDSNINGNGQYGNEWLMSRMGLANDLPISAETSDKIAATAKGYAQGLADFGQNTLGAGATWVGVNTAAGIGKGVKAVAGLFGADTSEGTVWDRMSEGLTWEEARKEASSEDYFKEGILTEDMPYFEGGRMGGQMTTELGATLPLGGVVYDYIKGAKNLGTLAKFLAQGANAAAQGAAFEGMDDVSNWDFENSPEDLGQGALRGLGTAAAFDALGSVPGALFKAAKKLGLNKLFGPKPDVKNAISKVTPEEWNFQSKVNQIASADANAETNFYKEFGKELDDAGTKAFEQRIAKGKELGKARDFDLQYKPGENYTIDDALTDINNSLKEISNSKRFGNKAGEAGKEPQFFFNKKTGKIEVTNPEALANMSSEITQKGGTVKTVNLLDEINDAYSRTFSAGAKENAATVDEFIRNLNSIMDKSWNGGPNNFLNLAQEGVRNARNTINSKLTEDSLKAVEKLTKEDEYIIKLTNSWKNLVGDLNKGVGGKNGAETALKGGANVEELFREIYKATGIDLNNKVLSWAYNMSMYDKSKAKDIIEYFYPSKAGVIESIIKSWAKPIKRSVAKDIVNKEGAIRTKNANKTLKNKNATAEEKQYAQSVVDNAKATEDKTKLTEINDIIRILNDKTSPTYMKKNAIKRGKEILGDRNRVQSIGDIARKLMNNKGIIGGAISSQTSD